MNLRPPSGSPPPATATIDEQPIDLVSLAREICERYYRFYPDEHDRYGPAGRDWCHHDNQWLLSWAVADVLGATSLDEHASWLARVLHSRAFPVERLAHNLRLAGEVVRDRKIDHAPAIAECLDKASLAVSALDLD